MIRSPVLPRKSISQHRQAADMNSSYSEDTSDDGNSSHENDILEMSYTPGSSSSSLQNSSTPSRCERFTDDESRFEKYTNGKSTPIKKHKIFMFNNSKVNVVTVFVVATLGIICYYYYPWLKTNDAYLTKEECHTNNFKRLKSSFPQQDTALWVRVKSAISGNTSTLILIYNEENRQTAKCLGQKILELYKGCHPMKEISIVQSSSIFHESSRERIILNLRDKLEQPALMFLEDLQSITSNAARVFHVICDNETHFKMPFLYVFTFRNSSIDDTKIQTSRENTVRKLLQQQWNDLSEDVVKPIISRLVTYVADVHNEPQVLC